MAPAPLPSVSTSRLVRIDAPPGSADAPHLDRSHRVVEIPHADLTRPGDRVEFLPHTNTRTLVEIIGPGPYPDPGPCPTIPTQVSLGPPTATVGSYLDWGEACGINLGPNPTYGPLYSPADGHLRRELTRAERNLLRTNPPDIEADEVFALLTPEWTDRLDSHAREFSRRDAIRNLFLDPDRFPQEGLFFQGAPGALFFEPIALALRMIFAFAEYLDQEPYFVQRCLYGFEDRSNTTRMADVYRENLLSGAWEVLVFDDSSPACTVAGQPAFPVFQMVSPWRVSFLSRDWPGQTTAWTPLRIARLCPPYAGQCLLADYYLFWARRLLHLTLNGSVNPELDFALAQLCARSAFAEVAQLAALLVHEFSHIHGTWFECGVGLRLRAQACCHFMIQWIFNTGVSSALALPRAHDLPNSPIPATAGLMDRSLNRFNTIGVWNDFFVADSCGPDSSDVVDAVTGISVNGNAALNAVHSSLFGPSHQTSYSYQYMSQCNERGGDTSMISGTGSFFAAPSPASCEAACRQLSEGSTRPGVYERCIEECAP